MERNKEFGHIQNTCSDILSDDDDVHDSLQIELNKSCHSRNNCSDVSDSDDDLCIKKSQKKRNLPRNMIDSDTSSSSSDCEVPGDESEDSYNLHEADTLEVQKEVENISSALSKSSIIGDSMSEADETNIINLHEADTLEIQKEVENVSAASSKSNISIGESVLDADETNISSSSISDLPQMNYSVRTEDIVSTSKLNKVRISEDFHFEKSPINVAHSTLVEPQAMMNTPVNSSSGKRLLNKSIDTPRIFKLSKESNTPRVVKPEIHSRSPSPKIDSLSNEDIIDVSSDEDIVILKTPYKSGVNIIQKQTTLDSMFVKRELPSQVVQEVLKPELVSEDQYLEQEEKIKRLRSDLSKATNLLRTVNLQFLPDEGKSIKIRHESLENKLIEEVKKLSQMKLQRKENSQARGGVKVLSWEEIEARAGTVQPKTFGKQAMSTYNAQKAVTMDRLQQLHSSLETCPKESDIAEDPRGLKVELMPHQRRALAWLMWREKQKPPGGILADDMGLGKTLTMIALMIKTNESENDNDDSSDEENRENVDKKTNKYSGGTLVVCPASLINQWSAELERRTKRGLQSCEMYHGPKRETKPKRLAQYDMVVTTYAIVNNECEKAGAIFRVKWRRLIIDEAHQIRNHKSQTSEAVCRLNAKSRWALTGTPVHNKELDMYALLKFLRCSPFDDLSVWKRWVGDKSAGGTDRLHTVISSLMLRRTKAELIEKGTLNSLPERKWELVPVELSKRERDVYGKILIFSRKLFAQFLHQRAEKNTEALFEQSSTSQLPNGPNQEYFKMRQNLLRMNNIKDVKQHEILVLLLRLRQICCHPSLITGMLHEDLELLGDEDERAGKVEALDFLEQLNNMKISDDPISSNIAEGIGEEALGLTEAARGVLNPSDPVFSKESISSKIKAMLKVLREKVLLNNDKAIIVSQWSSYLTLISQHLRKECIVFDQLDGKVPVPKRMAMVDRFNNPQDQMKVLLLSLTAGGVGLNLVGANHLFLLDLHWNPQLENQAQDRIYRMGQKKPVFVYKFMATDTIENRILELQEKKLSIANSMLTGTKQVISSKLTLQDLKMLFEM